MARARGAATATGARGAAPAGPGRAALAARRRPLGRGAARRRRRLIVVSPAFRGESSPGARRSLRDPDQVPHAGAGPHPQHELARRARRAPPPNGPSTRQQRIRSPPTGIGDGNGHGDSSIHRSRTSVIRYRGPRRIGRARTRPARRPATGPGSVSVAATRTAGRTRLTPYRSSTALPEPGARRRGTDASLAPPAPGSAGDRTHVRSPVQYERDELSTHPVKLAGLDVESGAAAVGVDGAASW